MITDAVLVHGPNAGGTVFAPQYNGFVSVPYALDIWVDHVAPVGLPLYRFCGTIDEICAAVRGMRDTCQWPGTYGEELPETYTTSVVGRMRWYYIGADKYALYIEFAVASYDKPSALKPIDEWLRGTVTDWAITHDGGVFEDEADGCVVDGGGWCDDGRVALLACEAECYSRPFRIC